MPQPPVPFPPLPDGDAQPVAPATETLATVIIKFQEAVSLADVWYGNGSPHAGSKTAYGLTEDYIKSSQEASAFYGPTGTYKPAGIDEFWQLISASGGTLEPLLNRTKPSLLLGLLERAYQRPARMKASKLLQSANPFTYAKVICPVGKALDLEKALQTFTPDGNPDRPLLELAYVRGVVIPAGGLPPAAPPTNFLQLLNVPNTPYPGDSPARLHIVDYAWLAHPAYNPRLDIAQRTRFAATDPVTMSEFFRHGCWVLGVLIGDNSQQAVKGVVPGASVSLYSAFAIGGTTHIDDALAHAFEAATTNDVILLELALTSLFKFDRAFSAGIAKPCYPLDMDQACYDLIWLATNELGLTIVEPAGNSTLDLDNLDRFWAERNRPIDPYKRVDYEPNYTPTGKLAEGTIIRHARYLSNQLPADPSLSQALDSGAIMVGAATLDSAQQWVNSTNFGTRVDCAAPGAGLKTTDTNGGYTAVFGETSGASALIAGFLLYLKANHPDLSAISIRRLFRSSEQNPVGQNGPVSFPDLGALLLQLTDGG